MPETFENMSPVEKMRATLRDMNQPDYSAQGAALTGVYLEAHGIEQSFIVENIGLLQILNERPDIVRELKSRHL